MTWIRKLLGFFMVLLVLGNIAFANVVSSNIVEDTTACRSGQTESECSTKVDLSPVDFTVFVNNYPDSSTGQKIEGYVNIYKVNPVNSGKYKGELIETVNSPEGLGANFTVYYGDMVDFVGFANFDSAKKAKTWVFESPPYKNFGNGKGLCQINYPDTRSILKTGADNLESCAISLGIPSQDRPVDSVSISVDSPKTAKIKVIAVDKGPAGTDTPSVKGVKVYLKSPVTGKILSEAKTTSNGVEFKIAVGDEFYVTSYTSETGWYGFYQQLEGSGVPTMKVVSEDGTLKLCKVSDNSCTSSLEIVIYKIGEGVPSTPEVRDQNVMEYTININKGWNLVSVPLDDEKFISSTCDNSVYYIYSLNAYAKKLVSEFNLDPFTGFWFKSDKSCKLAFKGKPYYASDVSKKLYAGWSMIGAPKDTVSWLSASGCSVTSGPYSYNQAANKWERATVLRKGEGYFVKVDADCVLAFGDLPPLPE